VTRIIAGVCLQALCILTGYMSVRMLYSACWLGILVLSAPLFVASVFVLMKSGAPLWLRVILSVWPLIVPLTKWDLWG
jgi:hypothetical protein